MSNLSSLVGSGVKSIQTGEIALDGNNAMASAALVAVNMAKSVLFYQVRQGSDSEGVGATLVLESATLLRAKAGDGSNTYSGADTRSIVWQLVEFF